MRWWWCTAKPPERPTLRAVVERYVSTRQNELVLVSLLLGTYAALHLTLLQRTVDRLATRE